MNKHHYDYCDTYDAYYNGLSLDHENKIKTFSCTQCTKLKPVLKKSVSDPVFKCEECIEASSLRQQGQQGQQGTEWKWFSFF